MSPVVPKAATLRRKIKEKGWTAAKVAMLLRVRYRRKIDDTDLQSFIRGRKFCPDTLRSQIATVLGQKEKEVFPEYLKPQLALRSARIARGWSQADLARQMQRLGRRTRSTEISCYERGTKFCHPQTRKLLSQILRIAIDDLFPPDAGV